jgi:hypothetical protein
MAGFAKTSFAGKKLLAGVNKVTGCAGILNIEPASGDLRDLDNFIVYLFDFLLDGRVADLVYRESVGSVYFPACRQMEFLMILILRNFTEDTGQSITMPRLLEVYASKTKLLS